MDSSRDEHDHHDHHDHTGDLRLSDSERLHALNALGEHYAAGRIGIAEFEDLSGRASEVRWLGDLDPLFRGLPGGVPLAERGGAIATLEIDRPAPDQARASTEIAKPRSDEDELRSLRKRGGLVETLDGAIVGITLIAFLILQFVVHFDYAWIVWPSLVVTLSIPRMILRYSDEDEKIYEEIKDTDA
ncbi:DUF1707 SHOCT-like domain-containing protein, partial [Dietzia sp.]|uniref:DUF1707 SHOCT-like domain-containing protein n=1 Tax=Dietzia sp. TaxID=1871616 RepID=UPI002FDA5B3D